MHMWDQLAMNRALGLSLLGQPDEGFARWRSNIDTGGAPISASAVIPMLRRNVQKGQPWSGLPAEKRYSNTLVTDWT
jgi:hypothetical protein